MAGRPGQVAVPAYLKADISAHGFWKHGTTAMFGVRIFNLDVGSYLRMRPKKSLAKLEKENKGLYIQACLESRCIFNPVFYSIDVINRAGGISRIE